MKKLGGQRSGCTIIKLLPLNKHLIVLIVKVLVGAFNKAKVRVEVFSGHCEISRGAVGTCAVQSLVTCCAPVTLPAMLASAAPCPLTNTSRASTCGRNSFLLIQVITIQHLLYYHHNFRNLIPKLIHFITRKFQKFSIKDIILIITSHTLPLHRYTYVVFRRHGVCMCTMLVWPSVKYVTFQRGSFVEPFNSIYYLYFKLL